jgi:pyridinium-3,5-bisthiocarboxylic acid mononucleotide nickel chelatase
MEKDVTQIAYFDCFSGISGDMALGALLDVGVPSDVLLEDLKKIPIEGYSIRVIKEQRGLITGTRVLIEIDHQPSRSFEDIKELIYESKLEERVQQKILMIFDNLARAESRVHNMPPSEVHFHEVGAVDSILDVAGTVIGLHFLDIGRVYSSPVPIGRGFVKSHHGLLPLPAPATVLLLEGVPIYGKNIERELVTPTGAAILASLAEGYGPMPEMTLVSSGYGVGSDPASDPPNLLRMLVGTSSSSFDYKHLLMLETNIDDMNPEFYGHVLDKLFALGALDASLTPVQMKKNRPGVVLGVLIEPALKASMLELIFGETTTLGVRIHEVKRVELRRTIDTIQTPYGPCQVKRVTLPDGDRRVIPEYEACRRIAEEHRMSIRKVYEEILFLTKSAQ